MSLCLCGLYDMKYVSMLIVIVIIGAVIYFFPTDSRRVKKQFRALEQWAAKEGEENQLVMGRKIQKLRSVLADSVQVDAPAYEAGGTYDASEIAQRSTLGRSRYSTISLKFYDLEVDILDEQSAKVIATGRLTGTSAEGEKLSETHEVECLLQKVEGKWLLTDVNLVDVLQK